MKNEESMQGGALFWMESLGGIVIGEVMLTQFPVGKALSDLFYPQPVISFTYPRIWENR